MDNVMYYAVIVEEYYNAARPSYTRNGYEKNVLINKDTKKCIFVPSEVTPKDDELLFRLKTAGGQTFSTLKTAQPGKKEKTVVPTTNRIFKGTPQRTTYDTYTDTFVYTPDVIYNDFPMTIKVCNLDTFLKVFIELCGVNCNPYEMLDWLDRNSTSGSPYGLPREIVLLPYQNDHSKGVFEFRFKYFEELSPAVLDEHGAYICATFEFIEAREEEIHINPLDFF